MNLGQQYLANIHSLITDLIPLKICQDYLFLPISIDNRTPPRVLIAMVNPQNVIACDVLKKYVHRKNYKYKKSYITIEDYQRLINLYLQYLQNLEQQPKLTSPPQNLNYYGSTLSSQPLIENQAKFNDLVLGGKQKTSHNYLILGGIEGIKYRLNSSSLSVQVQALHDCLKYPNNCQQILLDILKKEKGLMVWVAYSLLTNFENIEPEIKNNLPLFNYQRKRESLQGVNLDNVNLQNIDLLESNLDFANLRKAIINEKTKLNSQVLLYWQIVNQGLFNYNLSNFLIQRANLSYGKLVKLNCYQTKFIQIQLSESNLEQIKFVSSDLINVNLQNSNLTYLDFQNTSLNKINFANSFLNKVSFLSSNLIEINFRNTKLNNLDFNGALLEKVDFYQAQLNNINFKNATLKQVSFNEATLRNVDMSYLNLSQTKINFNRIDLSESKFIRTNFQGLNLSNTNLRGANLSGANLANTNLTDANLTNAKLTLAIFNRDTVFPRNFDPERAGAIYDN